MNTVHATFALPQDAFDALQEVHGNVVKRSGNTSLTINDVLAKIIRQAAYLEQQGIHQGSVKILDLDGRTKTIKFG